MKLAAIFLFLFVAAISPTAQATPPDVLETLTPAIRAAIVEFSQIPEDRRSDLKQMALFVQAKLQAGETAQITFICTHNSRRSHLAQIWAQTAAAYYGVTGVKTFSGGIEATACNERTIRALRKAGFSVADSTGGKNPIYLVQYSEKEAPIRAFSKLYQAEGNPHEDYLAAMTCDSADAHCPIVRGASLRVGIHYTDPKEADGTDHESATYDERCRQIAREMFFLMSLVKG
jgi:protein-tyrosine-phosphatase